MNSAAYSSVRTPVISSHKPKGAAVEAPWSCEEFEARLRDKGAGYHIHHPFNVRLNQGRCSPVQVRGWIANRFYYQWCIPLKDAALLANCPDREVRREWMIRLLDHDGHGDHQGDAAGGLEAWTRLAVAAGLSRTQMINHLSKLLLKVTMKL